MPRIYEIPKQERPIERLYEYGVSKLSNEELLAILLKTGTKNKSSKDLALEILSKIDNIEELKNLTLEEFKKIDGIGINKACTLLSAIELGKRVQKSVTTLLNIKVNNSLIIYDYYKDIIGDKMQEYFYVVYLDQQKKIIRDKLLYIGTVNYSIVHPREIFKEAYKLSAVSLICIHNHPSDNVKPSKQDIEITKKIKTIGDLLGIEVCDHIIIGKNKYYSFFENGDL